MFDENTNIDQDLMMRSILEGAEEEVPASVWEGVSAGLDKAARAKVVALWFRRAGIGMAAAAAAVAAVLLVQPGDGDMDIVPASEEYRESKGPCKGKRQGDPSLSGQCLS